MRRKKPTVLDIKPECIKVQFKSGRSGERGRLRERERELKDVEGEASFIIIYVYVRKIGGTRRSLCRLGPFDRPETRGMHLQ